MRTFLILITFLGALSGAIPAQAPPALTAEEQQMMQAAFDGVLAEVQRLVEAGVSVHVSTPESGTALMWAAFNGHTPVVEFLLERGAAVDALDGNGRSALTYASSGPYVETVKILLDRGADVNLQGTLEGFTALMTAAAEGQAEVVELLLERGADLGLQDKDGDTAESFARQKGHAEVETLLNSHAAPASGDN
jgi:ankyrin repeat protein